MSSETTQEENLLRALANKGTGLDVIGPIARWAVDEIDRLRARVAHLEATLHRLDVALDKVDASLLVALAGEVRIGLYGGNAGRS
jgi:hypothetical protein